MSETDTGVIKAIRKAIVSGTVLQLVVVGRKYDIRCGLLANVRYHYHYRYRYGNFETRTVYLIGCILPCSLHEQFCFEYRLSRMNGRATESALCPFFHIV